MCHKINNMDNKSTSILKQKLKFFPMIVIVILLYIYNIFSFSPTRNHIKQLEYKIVNENYLIDTSGCTIPNYQQTIHFKDIHSKVGCHERAIFVKKISENEIQFIIDSAKFKRYKKNHDCLCWYKFVRRSTERDSEDSKVTYTQSKHFTNETKTHLLEEVVTVTCYIENNKHLIYEDSYMIVKKRNDTINDEQKPNVKWNVLLVGMDTMSRGRVYDTMPKTTEFLKTHGWLDFRGYHKVGYNTYPNLMAFMTGLNQSEIYGSKAKEMLVWNNFKDHGYTTAYGEDFLSCPDTFKTYGGFKKPPTHHYMRPLFLTGEKSYGHLLCTHKLSSGRQLLDYAYLFSNTYKNDSFFGLFWMNSYSHDPTRKPSQIDKHVKTFFEKLKTSAVLENTFVVFLSDHGIRFGEMRYRAETHYEERLPMLFMWVPPSFRDLHSDKYYNAYTNQHRLITPYDLHTTLMHILQLSNNSAEDSIQTDNPSYISIFEEHSEQRTCADASISDKWCACHNLTEINKTIHESEESIRTMETYIKQHVGAIKTTNCTICKNVELASVLRIHTYAYSDKQQFYVIGMRMSPINVTYEGVVVRNNTSNVYEMVGGVDIISSIVWSKKGYCAAKTFERLQCICESDPRCHKKAENNYYYHYYYH